MKRLLLIGLIAAAMVAVGCNPTSGGGSGGGGGTKVGVVNLGRVVEDNQWDKEINTRIIDLNNKYKGQLEQVSQALKDILEAKLKELGPPEKMSTAQRQQMAELQQKAQQYAQQALNDVNGIINQTRNEMTSQVTTALQTPVRQIAQQNGCVIVLMDANNIILYRDNSVDLTEKVIDEVKKNKVTINWKLPQTPDLRIPVSGIEPTATTQPAK